MVISYVRANALILLTYRYGPTGCLGVHAAIIDHIPHSPIMGVFRKQEKIQVYKDHEYFGWENSQTMKLTVSALP